MTQHEPNGISIELLIVELRLPGCNSLKEKRQRLGGIRERFGRLPNVSVCESGWQDHHRQAQWSFVAVGLDRRKNANALSRIEQFLGTEIDAVVTALHREQL